MKLGIKITKVHKILTFEEKPFLKDYIDLNTNLRKHSKNDLEKDLFKLMSNAIFGKSMENVLNRSNIKLINNDPEKLLKLIRQTNFQNAYQISNKLCLVESKPIKTIFNKPIPDVPLNKSKCNFAYKSSVLWNTLIGRVLHNSEASDNGIIITGSSENSDFCASVPYVKNTLRTFLLTIQKYGNDDLWEPSNFL